MSHPALKINHSEPYESISPLRPELSQKGKTILITGGNSGIGFAIARGFQGIIVARRPDVLEGAAQQLSRAAAEHGSSTSISWKVCDMADPKSVENLWAQLEKEHTVVDVLVLNAAAGGATAPILQSGLAAVGRL